MTTKAQIQQSRDLSELGCAIAGNAPMPMAIVEGTTHTLGYANPAFCRLMDKTAEQLVGKPFCDLLPDNDPCAEVLDRVLRTGIPERRTEQEISKPNTVFRAYSMWPMIVNERPMGVVIQVIETARFHEKTVEMNPALLRGLLRQQELAEASENVNTELRLEIAERKRIEEVLIKSEAWRRLLFENVKDIAIFSTDQQGRITDWNPGAERIFGYSRGEILGQDARVIFTPEDRAANAAETEMQIAEREGCAVDERWHLRKNGERFFANGTVRPLRNIDGKVFGFLKVARDITDKKRTELALRESEERYRNLFTSIDEGFCIIEMIFDEHNKPVDYRFLEVNPSFEKQTGLHNPAGKRMRELAPNHETHWYEIYGNVATTGIPVRFVNEAKALNRWYDVYAFRTGAPHSRQVAILFYDITERRRAELAIASLAAIVESSDDAIIGKDLNGIITSWNQGAERLFGYTPQEAIGQSITMLIPPDRLQEETEILDGIKRGKNIDHFDTIRVRKDGSCVEISLTISPLKDSARRIIGASKIARDISDRRRDEKALHLAQRQLADHAGKLEHEVAERTAESRKSIQSLEGLTYTMAHDLRAPLRAMQGLTEALLEDVPLNETGKDYAERIHKAAERMDLLINDLLDYGQLAHLQYPIRALSLKAEIQNALVEADKEIRTSQAEIEVCEPLRSVLANEMLLQQVLRNLIFNALKFVAPGVKPRIRIWAETISGGSRRDENQTPSSEKTKEPSHLVSHELIRLWIEDNGIGIAPEYQKKIFGIFQRLHTTTEFPGTGVGLAISKRAIEKMGGRVGVESEPGKGSRFWIELPEAS